MKNQVIKPIGTALWLLKNTKLSFRQIAKFVSVSEMEIRAMADGFDKAFLEPNNPINKAGQLTIAEIARCEANETEDLKLSGLPLFNDIEIKVSKKVFTPMSKRKDKVSGVLFLLESYPKLSSEQIIKLTGATKKMVEGVIDKTYSSIESVSPKDPIVSGLCTQVKLNEELEKAKKE
jgi:hypothetical protein